MRDNRMMSLLLAAAFLLTGCSENNKTSDSSNTGDISVDQTSEISRIVIDESVTESAIPSKKLFDTACQAQ